MRQSPEHHASVGLGWHALASRSWLSEKVPGHFFRRSGPTPSRGLALTNRIAGSVRNLYADAAARPAANSSAVPPMGGPSAAKLLQIADAGGTKACSPHAPPPSLSGTLRSAVVRLRLTMRVSSVAYITEALSALWPRPRPWPSSCVTNFWKSYWAEPICVASAPV
jgi:hypothetical protein